MLKMVDGTGIIGVDMVCPLGGAVSPPQPPNYDKVEVEGVGSLMLPNSLKAPLERLELIGNSVQGENPAPDNPQEIKSAGKWNEEKQKYEIDVKITGKNLLNISSETISRKNEDNKYNIQDGVITFNTINNWGGDFIYFNSVDVRNNKNLTFSANATLPEDLNNPQGGCRILVNAYDKNGSLLMDAEKIFAENSYQWIYNEYYKGFCYYKRINESLLAKLADEVDKITVGVCYLNTVADYPVSISNVQVEYATVTSNYEPYKEQTVQIALDEPLRGVGGYKDMLTKDGVVRRILEAPLVKYLKPVINGNVGNRYVFVEVPNANINYDRERCMSNVGFTNSTEKKKYIPHPYQLNFLIRVADDDTIEMVKEKIKDIIVAYTAKEPITEPLPESVQAQLQALHSENGVTHVFVDSGEVEAGIKLTYRKEI